MEGPRVPKVRTDFATFHGVPRIGMFTRPLPVPNMAELGKGPTRDEVGVSPVTRPERVGPGPVPRVGLTGNTVRPVPRVGLDRGQSRIPVPRVGPGREQNEVRVPTTSPISSKEGARVPETRLSRVSGPARVPVTTFNKPGQGPITKPTVTNPTRGNWPGRGRTYGPPLRVSDL